MRLPADLMAELTDYLEGILKNCELAAGIMSKMDLLVEASFGGRDAATVSKLITELAEREDATKAIQIDLTRRFLAAGDHLPPVETMLWLDVAFILSLVMVWKGLKNLKLDLNLGQALLVSAGVGLVVALLSLRWIKSLKAKHELERIEKKIELTDDEPEGIPFVRKKFRDQSRMGLPVSTTPTPWSAQSLGSAWPGGWNISTSGWPATSSSRGWSPSQPEPCWPSCSSTS